MNRITPPRQKAPRSRAVAMPRPKPTAAAALLVASVLSLPFLAVAILQALL